MAKSIELISPYSGKIINSYELDSLADVNTKLDLAQQAFKYWSKLSLDERIRQVKECLNYFQHHAEAVATDISMHMGKPLAQSHQEIETFFDRARYMLDIAKETLAPDMFPEKDNIRTQINHEPLGVVLGLAAWNYPLLITVNFIVPALVAGNVVILKHSPLTPTMGPHFEKAFAETSVPNIVQSILLEHEPLAQVIKDSRIDFVSFTGSVAGGSAVYQSVANRFIDVNLELGGKDPAYVAGDANITKTVEGIVDGACYNAGQSCCSVERAYVHHSVFNDFVDEANELMKKYVLGDPMADHTTMGPLASSAAPAFLADQVSQSGGQVLLGGKQLKNNPGNFFEPTLVCNPKHNSSLMQDESFGPILPVYKVQDDDEALALMNDTRFGLTASIWTRDAERAEYFAHHIDAGTIFQNRCDYPAPHLAWTGHKDSGKGLSLSKYGYYALTKRKNFHFRKI